MGSCELLNPVAWCLAVDDGGEGGGVGSIKGALPDCLALLGLGVGAWVGATVRAQSPRLAVVAGPFFRSLSTRTHQLTQSLQVLAVLALVIWSIAAASCLPVLRGLAPIRSTPCPPPRPNSTLGPTACLPPLPPLPLSSLRRPSGPRRSTRSSRRDSIAARPLGSRRVSTRLGHRSSHSATRGARQATAVGQREAPMAMVMGAAVRKTIKEATALRPRRLLANSKEERID